MFERYSIERITWKSSKLIGRKTGMTAYFKRINDGKYISSNNIIVCLIALKLFRYGKDLILIKDFTKSKALGVLSFIAGLSWIISSCLFAKYVQPDLFWQIMFTAVFWNCIYLCRVRKTNS